MAAFRILLAALLLSLAPGAVFAQEAKGFSVLLSGPDFKAATLTAQTLAGLPQVEREVSFKTSAGTAGGTFKGVLVWDILQATKALDSLGDKKELTHSFMVVSADGYQIAFSIGEIAPEFGNAPVMLATEMDGKPIEKGFRIIVPGDSRGARNVREVAKIELK